MIPEEGHKFGPYEILGRLGGGAMGVVFRAWDERLHREVALKLLQDEYQMPGMRARFLQEARAASALNHPNICTIFDIGEQEGEPYLVMELLEGQTLKERIAQGALSAEEIALYTREIADALALAHGKGIVHRDIKPANIFLVRKGERSYQAKVLDFGLAKIDLGMQGGRLSRTLDLTVAGATVGTLSYMSPEQARGKPLDSRSDLFSLGVMMYEMATRRVPFQGSTSALVFVQLLGHAPEPVQMWNESIPRSLERVILKLMMKDREQRFQNAGEVVAALERLNLKPMLGWGRKGGEAPVPLVKVMEPVGRAGNGGQRVQRGASSSAAQSTAVEPPMARATVNPALMAAAILEAKAAAESELLLSEREEGGDDSRSSDPLSEEIEIGTERPEDQRAGEDAGEEIASPGTEVIEEYLHREHDEDLERYQGVIRGSGGTWRSPVLKAGLAGVALFAMLGLGHVVRIGRLRPRLLGHGETLLLTDVKDRTSFGGQGEVSGALTEGLELALQGTGAVTVRGGEAFRAGLRQIAQDLNPGNTEAPARAVAQRVGAKAYLYGELTRSGDAYLLSIEVLDTSSNDRLATLDARASDKAELPAILERLALELRMRFGESVRAKGVSGRQSTDNLKALSSYAEGEAARDRGDLQAALEAYRSAVGADSHFVQPHLRMAWIFSGQRAEIAAAQEAQAGNDAASDAAPELKVMAAATRSLLATGNLVQAEKEVEELTHMAGLSSDALVYSARLELAEGHAVEALESARQAYQADPFRAAAYQEAEDAMLELNHYGAALELATEARRMGLSGATQDELLVAYLQGDAAALRRELADAGSPTGRGGELPFRNLYNYAMYLDDTGHTAAGALAWRTAGMAAAQLAGMESVEAAMLAQGALDRAIVGDCEEGMELAGAARPLPKGPKASFHLGVADALCGQLDAAEEIRSELLQRYSENTRVQERYLRSIGAAIALRKRDPQTALQELAQGREDSRDASSGLRSYLDGLAEMEAGEPAIAIPEFQAILDHQGAGLLHGEALARTAAEQMAHASAPTARIGRRKGALTCCTERRKMIRDAGNLRGPATADKQS